MPWFMMISNGFDYSVWQSPKIEQIAAKFGMTDIQEIAFRFA